MTTVLPYWTRQGVRVALPTSGNCGRPYADSAALTTVRPERASPAAAGEGAPRAPAAAAAVAVRAVRRERTSRRVAGGGGGGGGEAEADANTVRLEEWVSARDRDGRRRSRAPPATVGEMGSGAAKAAASLTMTRTAKKRSEEGFRSTYETDSLRWVAGIW